jgi:TatD DNase family protein
MFCDTHCHFDMMHLGPDNERLITVNDLPAMHSFIADATQQQVMRMITIGTNVITSRNAVFIATHSPHLYATVGVHPCDATASWRDQVKELTTLIEASAPHVVVGIGEVGLDYFHQPYDRQRQSDLFKAQIELALKFNLPLSLHVRDAMDDAMRILEPYTKEARGVFHCFQGSLAYARELVSWGFYLGIDGPLTYPKNEEMRATVAALPLDRLLLETDAPFLAPQRYRGRPNRPAYLPEIAATIATSKGVTREEVGMVTSTSASQLFSLPATNEEHSPVSGERMHH